MMGRSDSKGQSCRPHLDRNMYVHRSSDAHGRGGRREKTRTRTPSDEGQASLCEGEREDDATRSAQDREDSDGRQTCSGRQGAMSAAASAPSDARVEAASACRRLHVKKEKKTVDLCALRDRPRT